MSGSVGPRVNSALASMPGYGAMAPVGMSLSSTGRWRAVGRVTPVLSMVGSPERLK
jgi:hypothetical protein